MALTFARKTEMPVQNGSNPRMRSPAENRVEGTSQTRTRDTTLDETVLYHGVSPGKWMHFRTISRDDGLAGGLGSRIRALLRSVNTFAVSADASPCVPFRYESSMYPRHSRCDADGRGAPQQLRLEDGGHRRDGGRMGGGRGE
jgi:hypothetical protein